MRIQPLIGFLLILVFFSTPIQAGQINVAVASNFIKAIRDLAANWEQSTEHRAILVTGSTGKLYAQIRNGAPFEAFFAADARRPQLLEAESLIVPGSRFTYAQGRLVLWSPDPGRVDPAGEVLARGDFEHIAVANPKLAPYGRAAEQVLRTLGQWERLRGRMVRGENIGQTFQFVHSGNAALGFVADSQVRYAGPSAKGSLWVPPQSLYDPIEQQAVLLRDHPVAREFITFVRSPAGRKIIRSHGYELP